MSFADEFKSTEAEDGGSFGPIEEGEYTAELSDCKLDLSKTPARLSLTYDIKDHEVYGGRKVFGNYQLEGRGIGFLKKDLNTLGLDYSEVGSEEDIATLIWDNMPMQVVIFVNQREYNGKTYNNVYLNDVIPDSAASAAAQQPPAKAAPPAAKKSAPPSGKTAASAPARGKGRKGSDDEIPF